MKTLQILSDEQLRQGQQLTADQVLAFLEDFRRLHAGKPAPSKLISIKIAGDLLNDANTANPIFESRMTAMAFPGMMRAMKTMTAPGR